MANVEEVKVPDIGDFDAVEIIEVLVKVGDSVKAEDPLITLESDKATMEVPSPAEGKITEMKVKEGDKVSQGDVILMLEADDAGGDESDGGGSSEKTSSGEAEADASSGEDQEDATQGDDQSAGEKQEDAGASGGGGTREVEVPDIGDFDNVEVIEVLVKAGDSVKAEDPLITLESDKATMEVPSPAEGKIKEMKVKEGDKVSQGDIVLVLEETGGAASDSDGAKKGEQQASTPKQDKSAESKSERGSGESKQERSTAQRRPAPGEGEGQQGPAKTGLVDVNEEGFLKAHASPSVRRLARQLGVDLSQVDGSGRKNRIVETDVHKHVKQVMQGRAGGAAAGGGGLPTMPDIDFSKFGETEVKELPRIRRLSAQNLHRNWVVVPHVTQFDQADITELEAFRKAENEHLETKLTLLPVLIKASAKAIAKYPEFASSLDPAGQNLIMKHYIHIGFAVDTPNGLLVPVIRDVDKKGVAELATESRTLAKKARDGKIKRDEMQGGVFSITSLGGIGGTAFTPIVNAPEVAILGVSSATMQPVWKGGEFVPRLMLPLSMAYDHRVIDGAKAARFTRYLCELLSDIRRLLL